MFGSGSTISEPHPSGIDLEHREECTRGPCGSPFSVLQLRVRELLDDGGTALAAALTHYSVLSILPALIAQLAPLLAEQRDIRLAAAGPGDPAGRPFGRS